MYRCTVCTAYILQKYSFLFLGSIYCIPLLKKRPPEGSPRRHKFILYRTSFTYWNFSVRALWTVQIIAWPDWSYEISSICSRAVVSPSSRSFSSNFSAITAVTFSRTAVMRMPADLQTYFRSDCICLRFRSNSEWSSIASAYASVRRTKDDGQSLFT